MLAADCASLRDARDEAAAQLRTATDEELAWPDAPAVLGDAAIRVQAWDFGLRATAETASPDAERIRASCLLALANSPYARARLEALIQSDDGENSTAAAAMLLVHAALRRRDWSELAENYLRARRPESEWLPLKAFYLAQEGNTEAALRLLDPLSDDPWALHAQLQISRAADLVDQELARRVLRSNPEQWLRAEAARVLVRARHADEAEAHARAVAEDENTPPRQRAVGYDVVLEVLQANERWNDAGKELEAWTAIDPTDEMLSFWRVRVGNRLARAAAK
jgi:hypothetical protein